MKLTPPLPYNKLKALSNLEEYLIPELRVKKSKVTQLLPSTKQHDGHKHTNRG